MAERAADSRDGSGGGGVLRPAHVYAAQRDWPGYFAAVAGSPPRETLLAAIKYLGGKAGPGDWAIDVGCGEGRDTKALLEAGFSVLAIDGHPDGLARLEARGDLPEGARGRLTTRLAALEALPGLPRCRLLNASFTLPFILPGAFARVWGELEAALEPGGVFAGQLFGERDSWASLPDRSHHTRAEVETLLTGFRILELREDERAGADVHGQAKHWHVFHVVAEKVERAAASGVPA
ncbi:MAG: class I SAM-dependent methyltransferase [Planctomycetaceae bacterium]|nr:class I SAM-dependent methyltransferase [Phycisphaerales bacterium]MCE2653391.1 class I SAM-dependent methyltransferase [Planctomycetaceae bacterium]